MNLDPKTAVCLSLNTAKGYNTQKGFCTGSNPVIANKNSEMSLKLE